MSHLARGGWIEIPVCLQSLFLAACLTSQEVGGLKFHPCEPLLHRLSLTSQEVGGLKYRLYSRLLAQSLSHLARGGWIEINKCPLAWNNSCSLTSQEVGGLK